MSSAYAKQKRRARRAHRVRAAIRGTAERPRLSVYRTARHISAQLINDQAGTTIASSSDVAVEAKGKKPMEVAALVGADLAAKGKAAGATSAVFDRGSYKYHGRVKALADAAREGGLEF